MPVCARIAWCAGARHIVRCLDHDRSRALNTAAYRMPMAFGESRLRRCWKNLKCITLSLLLTGRQALRSRGGSGQGQSTPLLSLHTSLLTYSSTHSSIRSYKASLLSAASLIARIQYADIPGTITVDRHEGTLLR